MFKPITNGKEYSDISVSGITMESTPIRNKPDSNVSEFVTVHQSTFKNNSHENTEDVEELDSILNTHPELNIASRETGELNPVNVAYTMFSPRKSTNNTVIVQPPTEKPPSSPSTYQPVYNFLLDPMVPYTLTLYFQLLFNVILIGVFLYVIYLTYTAIKTDINFKIQSYILDLLDEISQCSKQYVLNKCDSPNRPPAIEVECNLLDKCQNQDPTLISRSKITSEILAEIVNSFFNKISYKSIAILVLFSVVCILLNHYIIGNFQLHELNKLSSLENKIKEQHDIIEHLKRRDDNIDNLEQKLAP